MSNTKSEVVVQWFDVAHDGEGWYYYPVDYKEDGSCGAFATSDEAVKHADDSGYTATVIERKAT